jgi:hypothetical protein
MADFLQNWLQYRCIHTPTTDVHSFTKLTKMCLFMQKWVKIKLHDKKNIRLLSFDNRWYWTRPLRSEKARQSLAFPTTISALYNITCYQKTVTWYSLYQMPWDKCKHQNKIVLCFVLCFVNWSFLESLMLPWCSVCLLFKGMVVVFKYANVFWLDS